MSEQEETGNSRNDQTDLHRDTGGVAGAESVQTAGSSCYRGSLGAYICTGGAIGAVVGLIIGLAAGIYWLGGLVIGAICGAAIGLYVVETKRP